MALAFPSVALAVEPQFVACRPRVCAGLFLFSLETLRSALRFTVCDRRPPVELERDERALFLLLRGDEGEQREREQPADDHCGDDQRSDGVVAERL
jgi:hypothetical protein